jgi:hypothetical protein
VQPLLYTRARVSGLAPALLALAAVPPACAIAMLNA